VHGRKCYGPPSRQQQQPPADRPVEPGKPRVRLKLSRQKLVDPVQRRDGRVGPLKGRLAFHRPVVSAIALSLQTT